MCQALEELLADKYKQHEEIGEKRGMQHGERLKLLSIVNKMLTTGRELTEIAELLGEEYSVIQGCVQELHQEVR